jgi:hypothetical protein
MDYKKTGTSKPAKGTPRFDPHKPSAKTKGTTPEQEKKDALLVRMKAAAEKRDAD